MDINSLQHHVSNSNSNSISLNSQGIKSEEKEPGAITLLREQKSSSVNQEHVDKNSQPVEKTTESKQADAEYQQVIAQLKSRDREVRAHEAAHLAAAGQHARGGASYSYQTGPDGRQYAIGGEVSIDTSAIPNDPEATLAKAQQIQRAALAPAEPSAQDIAVAGQASQMAIQARKEIAEARLESTNSTNDSKETEVKNENPETPSSNRNDSSDKNPSMNALLNQQNQFQIRNLLAS